MYRGYIKLWRCIEDNEYYLLEKFTKGQAWIDLILLANHQDKLIDVRGNEVLVKRGFVGRSEESLAKRWKWSRDKVRRFKEALKTRQQIRQHKSSVLSQIEILNYELYQPDKTTDKTTEKQQTRQQKNTNKNDKNDNNENNDKEKNIANKFDDDSKEINLSKLLIRKIIENNPDHKLTTLSDDLLEVKVQKYAAEVDKMVRLDARSYKQIEFMINWCQQDDFWKANILSMNKLRKQFDTLIVQCKRQIDKHNLNSIPNF